MHLQPRLRRFGSRLSPTAIAEITAGLIAGPLSGPPWLQTLKEPVPSALREEWRALACRLRHLRADHGRQNGHSGTDR